MPLPRAFRPAALCAPAAYAITSCSPLPQRRKPPTVILNYKGPDREAEADRRRKQEGAVRLYSE